MTTATWRAAGARWSPSIWRRCRCTACRRSACTARPRRLAA